MWFLANENFPLDAVEALRQQGHDVAWIRIKAASSRDIADKVRTAITMRKLIGI